MRVAQVAALALAAVLGLAATGCITGRRQPGRTTLPATSPLAGFHATDAAAQQRAEAELEAIMARLPAAAAPAAELDAATVAAALRGAGLKVETTTQRGAVVVSVRLEGSSLPGQIVVVGGVLQQDNNLGPDPASATMLKLARGLARMHAAGWRPRRSLHLVFWADSRAAAAWLSDSLRRGEAPPLLALLAGTAGDAASEIVATPDLFMFLETLEQAPRAGLADGRGPGAAFLSESVPTLTMRVSGEAAALMRTAVLRLAAAPLPLLGHSTSAQQIMDDLRLLDEESLRIFAANPPPSDQARVAITAYRDAAEVWEAVSSRWLAAAPAFPAAAGSRRRGGRRQVAAALQLRRLVASGALAGSVAGAFRLDTTTTARPLGSCPSMVACAGKEADTAPRLPGLRRALATGSRADWVTEMLQLTEAAQRAAARLRQATFMLQAPEDDLPAARAPH